MKNQLIEFIINCVTINDSDLEFILSKFKHKRIPKNEILLNTGEICKEFYFVEKGCLRVYFLTNKGVEKTNHIALENTIITALSSFISQTKTYEMIDALENTDLLYISHHDFFKLVEKYKAWELFYRLILETAYIKKVQRIESRVTLSAKERFENVIKEQPELLQRVSNKILSSFIDVTQETLSRLKS